MAAYLWQLVRQGFLWLFSGPYLPPSEPRVEPRVELPEPEEEPIADLPVIVPALKKLNIGCGPRILGGWVSVDIVL